MKSLRRVAGVIAGITMVVAVAAGPAGAAFPGKNGAILVERNGVLRIDDDPDTPGETLVFSSSSTVGDVRFSPDGTRVVFLFLDDGIGGTGKIQIGTSKADGSGSRRLTSGSTHASQPDWSPDGTRVVFVRENAAGDRQRLVVMRADGSDQRAITSAAANERHIYPVWSPDGRTIAFTVSDDDGIRVDLVRPDGTGRQSLGDGDGASFPAWSPDGRSIALERGGDIVIRTLATGVEETVVPSARTPVFSPDGTRLLYEAQRQIGPGVFADGVWMHRFDGAGPDVIIAGNFAASAAWQPLCSIKGTAGDNRLTGTAKAELICGRGGRDTIDGKGGGDIILGGPGNDVLNGGGGPDVLVGSDGNDRFDGGAGSDQCVQGPGSGTKTSCER